MGSHKQRGQLLIYSALGAGAIILAMGLALWLQGGRLEACKEKHAGFVAQVEANGKIAKDEADKKEAADKLAKEKADAQNKRATDSLKRTIASLRKSANTSGGSLSPNPSGSQCPQGLICFDKAEYQRADGRFVTGARGLADEGSQVAIDLDTARQWAQLVLKMDTLK